jgi:hypothetical protein
MRSKGVVIHATGEPRTGSQMEYNCYTKMQPGNRLTGPQSRFEGPGKPLGGTSA